MCLQSNYGFPYGKWLVTIYTRWRCFFCNCQCKGTLRTRPSKFGCVFEPSPTLDWRWCFLYCYSIQTEATVRQEVADLLSSILIWTLQAQVAFLKAALTPVDFFSLTVGTSWENLWDSPMHCYSKELHLFSNNHPHKIMVPKKIWKTHIALEF